MQTLTNITIYKCDFCKKELKRKHAMVNHELKCHNNPINIPFCVGCEHLEEIKITYYFVDYNDVHHEHAAMGFKCLKLKKTLYHPAAKLKGLPDKYPETFDDQEMMPIEECKDYLDPNGSFYLSTFSN